MDNKALASKLVVLNDETLKKDTLGTGYNGYRPHVSVPKDYNLRGSRPKAEPGGLYDPRIFGLADRCICRGADKTLYEMGKGPKLCPKCRVWVMSKDDYEENYALYTMPVPTLNFLREAALVAEITKIFGGMPKKLPKNTTGLWSLYLYEDDKPFVIKYDAEYDDVAEDLYDTVATEAVKLVDKTGKTVYCALFDIPGKLDDLKGRITVDRLGKPVSMDNVGLIGLKKLSKYFFPTGQRLSIIGDCLNQELVVTSPSRRAMGFVRQENGEDKLTAPVETTNYYALMSFSDKLKNYLASELSIQDKATYCWFFNTMVNAHYATSSLLQPSKQSLTRTLMDTRVKYSLRATIIGSRDLEFNTVGLPEQSVYEIMAADIIEELVSELSEDSAMSPISLEDISLTATKLYKQQDKRAKDVLFRLVEQQPDSDLPPMVCKLVRNPTLHKFNMMTFKIKLVKGTAIQLPIAVDEMYNADHDGDTVSVWLYKDPEYIANMINSTPDKFWHYDKTNSSPYIPKDEVLYGLYQATVKHFSSEHQKFKNFDEAEAAFENGSLKVNVECDIGRIKNTTYGRQKLTKIMNIDIEQFLKYTPQTSDELTLPELKLPEQNETESKSSYNARVAKAKAEYEKALDDYKKTVAFYKKEKFVEMNGIGVKNIGRLITAMAGHPDRVKIYLEMQQFATRIATIVGLGPVLNEQIFFGITQKQIDDILKAPYTGKNTKLAKDAEAMERKSKLRKLYQETISRNMLSLPDSNIRELLQSFGKVNLEKLMYVYCPTITGETLETLDARLYDSVFDGLSEQAYYSLADHDRATLAIKQDIVPVSGYATRQWTDAAIETTYNSTYMDAMKNFSACLSQAKVSSVKLKKEKSPDTVGVLLLKEDAMGRTLIPNSEQKINGRTYVRVVSCATNTDPKYENLVCYDELAHNLKIPNIDKYNNPDKDESVSNEYEQFNLTDGSNIGIAFLTGITECLTQAGLGFKHGGDLNTLDKESVHAPCECEYLGIEDRFLKLRTLEPCASLGFREGTELKYRITDCCIVNSDFQPGDFVLKGTELMKKQISVKPDDLLTKIFAMTGTKAAGSLGNTNKVNPAMSWSVNAGKIEYTDSNVYIDGIGYTLDEEQIYLYPDGAYVGLAQEISSGIPDMVALKQISDNLNTKVKDYGILYSVFYYYMKSLKPFSKFISEPFEVLFKTILPHGFSITNTIAENTDLLIKLYYGGALTQFKDAISDAYGSVNYQYNRRIADLLNSLDDATKQEMDLKNTSVVDPTYRRISISKNMEGGYDWKNLFRLMFNEATNDSNVVVWTWDQVKRNLRQYNGSYEKNGVNIPIVTKSIATLEKLYNETPKEIIVANSIDEQVQTLQDEANGLFDQIANTSSKSEKSRLQSQIDSILTQIDKLVKDKTTYLESHKSMPKDYWYRQLEAARKRMQQETNTSLMDKLSIWLTKGKYGSSLHAYVKYNRRGISLTISKLNYTESEQSELDFIQNDINTAKDQAKLLDPDKASDRQKLEELDKTIKELESKKAKVAKVTTPRIDLNKTGKMSILAPMLLSKHNWDK